MLATAAGPPRNLSIAATVALSLVLFAILGLVEWLLGREFLTGSGLGIWTGAWTRHTSQWLTDPYTFSHVLHGVFFYWLLLPTRNHLAVRPRFLIASLVEVGWEILENSPYIIERYRNATAALEYQGDSIVNSMVDLLAAMAGFWIAWRFSWKWVLAFVVAVELFCLFIYRDNLFLNILMLLSPSEAIKDWQLGK